MLQLGNVDVPKVYSILSPHGLAPPASSHAFAIFIGYAVPCRAQFHATSHVGLWQVLPLLARSHRLCTEFARPQD